MSDIVAKVNKCRDLKAERDAIDRKIARVRAELEWQCNHDYVVENRSIRSPYYMYRVCKLCGIYRGTAFGRLAEIEPNDKKWREFMI